MRLAPCAKNWGAMSSAIERLRTTHHLALRAQHASDWDSAALMRAWPQLATSAHAAYAGLPALQGADDRVAERIALDARSLIEAAGHEVWPGAGAPDQALKQVAAGFRAAADSLATDHPRSGEVAEARRLIISSLWTTSRLVCRATRDHGFNLSLGDGSTIDDRVRIAQLTTVAHLRLGAIEQLAANGLRGQAHHEQSGPAAQLRSAVAMWDIEAHRALGNDRSTAVLHVLAHQEAASVKVFEMFIDRAAGEGVIDPLIRQRLMPVLADSSASWATLRDTAAQFSFSSTVVPMSLIDAATELRERFRDASHISLPDDRRDVLGVMSSHLASAVTISATARDLISEGQLRAPARAIARVMSEQRPEITESLVSIRDVRKGVSVPLPNEARALLDQPATRVFHDAAESLNRTAGLDSLHHAPSNTPDSNAPTKQPPADPRG